MFILIHVLYSFEFCASCIFPLIVVETLSGNGRPEATMVEEEGREAMEGLCSVSAVPLEVEGLASNL